MKTVRDMLIELGLRRSTVEALIEDVGGLLGMEVGDMPASRLQAILRAMVGKDGR